jgi:hypothetical protein
MAFGTPYSIGHNTAGTAAVQTIVVATGTTAGDAIIVCTGNSSTSVTITSVTDSKSNSYAAATTASTSFEFGQIWLALNTTALTTSDTITVTYSTTTGNKGCIAVGCSGVVTSSAVDQAPTPAHAGSTAPTVTTGTLAQATEMAIGCIFSAVGGGVPSAPSLTQIVNFQSGSSPEVTAYYQATVATTAVTCSATLGASSNWCAAIITLLPAAGGGAAATPQPLVVPSLAAIQASVW